MTVSEHDSSVSDVFTTSHFVKDHDGYITMEEAISRGAQEYGKLTAEQCLELLRIMRA